jgi:hypothetical protein
LQDNGRAGEPGGLSGGIASDASTNERTGLLMAKTTDRARSKVQDATPYVKRAIQDEELRENLRSAYATARGVYEELIGNRGVTGVATKVASDTEIQDQLRSAIQDLRNAADRVQRGERHKRRNSSLLLAGIVLGLLFNPVTGPETRRWLKDKVFGEDEEFGFGSSGNSS